jgi:large subunit ribosomal protein L9
MELVLIKDVEHVGRKGDVVKVRDGFARNFLIPRQMGLPATRANRMFVEEQKVRSQKRRAKEKAEAEIKAKQMEQLILVIEAAAGDQEKLFGSVTAEDIRQVLSDQGHTVEKKRIILKEPIRTLGTHTVTVELFPQVKTNITVEVRRKA